MRTTFRTTRVHPKSQEASAASAQPYGAAAQLRPWPWWDA